MAPQASKSRNRKFVYACVAVFLIGAGAIAYFAPRKTSQASSALQSDPSMSAAVQHLQTTAQAHSLDDQLKPVLDKLKETPHDSSLLAQVGDGYYQGHDFPHAADYYQRSLAEKDDPAVRIKLGGVYFYSGEADRAIAEFQRILKTDPGNANALFNLGMARWQGKGDADGAVAAWRQLLKMNPNHPRRAEVEKLIATVSEHSRMPSAAKVQGPGQ